MTAWSISSWARGGLLHRVEYKAELVGIDVTTVNPWGTSRYCPRCGERGETVTAPNDHTACRSGGYFYCPTCGYECDRDVVGAVNVGRKFLGTCRMETANPCAYTARGDHASFPAHSAEECPRSTGVDEIVDLVRQPERKRSGDVQSATEQQDAASGRQTRLSQCRASSLTVKRSGPDAGGLHGTHSGNTGLRDLSGSITRWCLLASTTDSNEMVPNPAEN